MIYNWRHEENIETIIITLHRTPMLKHKALAGCRTTTTAYTIVCKILATAKILKSISANTIFGSVKT